METTLEPPKRGLSLDEAIREFVVIKSRQDELAEQEKDVKDVLIRAALEARTNKKTCRVANHNQSIVLKAQFYSYFKCDVKALDVVKEMIGDDLFERYFRVKYEPVSSELSIFMSTKTSDETTETAKELIKEAITESPESVRFSIEKS